MTDRISDVRIPQVMIEDAVVSEYNLTPYEGWLYVVIVKHSNRATNEAFPGIARLAKMSNMSRRKVIECIQSLEAKNLIRVERDELPLRGEDRKRGVNHYFILQATKPRVVKDSAQETLASSAQDALGVVHHSNRNHIHLEPSYTAPAVKKSANPNFKPMAQAIVDVFGYDWNKVTKQEKGKILAAAKSLCDVGLDPADVPKLHAYCRSQFTRFTPVALASNVSEWRKQGEKSTPPGFVSATAGLIFEN